MKYLFSGALFFKEKVQHFQKIQGQYSEKNLFASSLMEKRKSNIFLKLSYIISANLQMQEVGNSDFHKTETFQAKLHIFLVTIRNGCL